MPTSAVFGHTHTDCPVICPRIRAIGVGGCGTAIIRTMISDKRENVEFSAIDFHSDPAFSPLNFGQAEGTFDLGAVGIAGQFVGNNPTQEIGNWIDGVHVVVITAGLGGQTGTTFAPAIARTVRGEGILIIAAVTVPSAIEGLDRIRSCRYRVWVYVRREVARDGPCVDPGNLHQPRWWGRVA
jgi:cell division GTPase FtsZ